MLCCGSHESMCSSRPHLPPLPSPLPLPLPACHVQAFMDYQSGKLQRAEDNPWEDEKDEL